MTLKNLNLIIKNLPLAPTHCLIVGVVICLSVLAYFFDQQISHLFIYHRALITQGEVWRVFTGHFFHTNTAHLLLNLSGVILLWALHGQFYTIKNYCLLLLTSALICCAGLYYLSPDIQRYVGLSGVLHGIFVFGAIMDIRHKDKTGYWLLIGVWLKVAHEQFYGASEDVTKLIEANVAIDAHMWGAFGGVLFSLIYLLYLKHHKSLL